MQDMLVRLYALPDYSAEVERLRAEGVTVRRALPTEKHRIAQWATETFASAWGSESERALANTPASCFIAIEDGKIIGFACYDATCRNFFGPTGVNEAARGRGIGKALLWICLHAMYEVGYAYAIIGGVGPADFYAKAVGATIIEGSNPGIFDGIVV